MEVEVMAGEETFVWKESSGGLLKKKMVLFSSPTQKGGKVKLELKEKQKPWTCMMTNYCMIMK